MISNYSTEEAEIHAVTDEWAQAVRASNMEGVIKHYTTDIVAYDAAAQLQFTGREAYAKHWEYCMTACLQGPMIFDIKDLVIHTEKEVAFSYFLNRCGGKDENGNEKFSWMRATRGLRKIDGKWLAVHEHFSSPFDMESGNALFDLQP